MKRMNVVILVVAVMATLALAAFAIEERSSKTPGVFLLKSQGHTIAEVRVLPGMQCNLQAHGSSGSVEYDTASGTLHAQNGAVLKVIDGTNAVTVIADEIEGSPSSK